jgi:HD superfamily phosphohydrolase
VIVIVIVIVIDWEPVTITITITRRNQGEGVNGGVGEGTGSGEWKLVVKAGERLTPGGFGEFTSRIRLPVSGSIFLTREVKQIIDTPEFQRLRGVRQLGPAFFVFPGANHTRFEHSLGVYSLVLRYLERLLQLESFREAGEPLDETIKLIVLAALLHDIGHYPYSHWIEEISGSLPHTRFPDHEHRANEILSHGEISGVLKGVWGVEPERLATIIAAQGLKTRRDRLINSLINSVIDVDKVDYLVRDSVHCGVQYGLGIDVDRLLDALFFNEERGTICLTDKGRSILSSVLHCRNVMYQEVYWHKTVRSADAMFKRFFYEYVDRGYGTNEDLQRSFNYSDDHFLWTLRSTVPPESDLVKLICSLVFEGRKLYKPAYVFYEAAGGTELPSTRHFFGSVIGTQDYAGLVARSNRLAAALQGVKSTIRETDILVETTPLKGSAEKWSLQAFRIWNLRKGRYEEYPTEVDAVSEHLQKNRQAYVFCNQDHYQELQRLTPEQWDGVFSEVIR